MMSTTPILISSLLILLRANHAASALQVLGYPAVPDSDSVIVKEHQGTTYAFFKDTTVKWMQAHWHCVKYGMRLVDIPTRELFDWITTELIPPTFVGPAFTNYTPAANAKTWASMNDIDDEGHFKNLYDGRVHSEFFNSDKRLHEGVPEGGNNSNGKQNCACIFSFGEPLTYYLNDYYCDAIMPLICTIEKKTECQICDGGNGTNGTVPDNGKDPIKGDVCDKCLDKLLQEKGTCSSKN